VLDREGRFARNLALYEALVALVPEVERKGATNPYTSVNGNMFSICSPDGEVALRLPAERRQEFLERYSTHLREAYGIVQREYVVVPDDLLVRTDELAPWFEASYAYATGLRRKPTTRPKRDDA
jgi:hypothetical protein